MKATNNAGSAQRHESTELIRQGDDPFDYGSLKPEDRKQVLKDTSEIREYLEKTAVNIVQIGYRFNSVHDRIGRVKFQAWLAAEVRLTQATASNYMRAAAAFCDVNCVKKFQPTALYELVRRRVPEDARAEAIDRAKEGELITKDAAILIVRKYSAAAPRKTQNVASRVCRSLLRLAKTFDDLSAAEVEELHPHVIKLLSDFEKLRSAGANAEPRNRTTIVSKLRRGRRKSSAETNGRGGSNTSRKRQKRRRGG